MAEHTRLCAPHLFLNCRHAIDELSEFSLKFERAGKAGPNGIRSHACHTLRCGPSLFCAIVDSGSIHEVPVRTDMAATLIALKAAVCLDVALCPLRPKWDIQLRQLPISPTGIKWPAGHAV